jgi:ATPsynthase alpha/beta subunit N-term extension
MLGKVVEIFTEFVNISLFDSNSKVRIGDYLEFPECSVVGVVYIIEKSFCQVNIAKGLMKLKIGNVVQLAASINTINIDLFGNIWGESDSNLSMLDINFGTKKLELTGRSKYDFIPVVRNGKSVTKNQKLGYFELAKNLKYWILAPHNETSYEVKKINSGSFSTHDNFITVEKENKKYELGLSQQFYYSGKIISKLEIKEGLVEVKDFDKFDFVVSISEFLIENFDFRSMKFVTFLVSYSDNWEAVRHKAYNVGLFLAYCGHKVLFVDNLEFQVSNEGEFKFGTTINFEGEEVPLESLN